MLAAAVIPYVPEEHDFSLQDLLKHLTSKLSVECELIEVEEYGEPIPEIQVKTSTPLSIRIEDDAELVDDDLGYLAENGEGVLPIDWFDVLLRCTARLEVGESEEEWVEPDENGIMELDVYSNLDLTLPDVRAVVRELARFVDGFAYDYVNDEWLVERGKL
ncbi:MAG TPA: hypothetical protein VIA62_07080 [Thermoanaerobaculia bacterium]|jgi:hypothetical protein|nr:hypothetical protein [Thermoanaerobaculia bacterium]